MIHIVTRYKTYNYRVFCHSIVIGTLVCFDGRFELANSSVSSTYPIQNNLLSIPPPLSEFQVAFEDDTQILNVFVTIFSCHLAASAAPATAPPSSSTAPTGGRFGCNGVP